VMVLRGFPLPAAGSGGPRNDARSDSTVVVNPTYRDFLLDVVTPFGGAYS